jgi:hypothetical protein
MNRAQYRRLLAQIRQRSPVTGVVVLVTTIAVVGFGAGGLAIGAVLAAGTRRLPTPLTVGLLTGIVVLVNTSSSPLSVAGGIVVVLAPPVASKVGFSRTKQYLWIGSIVIAVPIAVIVGTTGTVWPAMIGVAMTLLGATVAVYWYTVPV